MTKNRAPHKIVSLRTLLPRVGIVATTLVGVALLIPPPARADATAPAGLPRCHDVAEWQPCVTRDSLRIPEIGVDLPIPDGATDCPQEDGSEMTTVVCRWDGDTSGLDNGGASYYIFVMDSGDRLFVYDDGVIVELDADSNQVWPSFD